MPQKVNVRARLSILGSAVLLSTGGAAIKLCSLSGLQVAGLRSAVAAGLILLLLPAARRMPSRKQLPVIICYAATLVLFATANKLTTSANAIFLQDAAPIFVLLLGPWVLNEKASRIDLVILALCAVGLTLFFLAEETAQATAPDPWTGNILALGAALTWAGTLLGLRWSERDPANSGLGMSSVAWGNLAVAVSVLPIAGPPAALATADIIAVLWLGAFQITLAYVLLTHGLRQLSALEASMLLLLEPALNPLWSWLLHGEKPAALSLIGGALILAATILTAWWRNRVDAAPEKRARPACSLE